MSCHCGQCRFSDWCMGIGLLVLLGGVFLYDHYKLDWIGWTALGGVMLVVIGIITTPSDDGRPGI